ncbi:MAG: bacterioferritin-associated ferredoxin [Parvularculaceae bacterium]
MYVCICNALKDRELEAAARRPARCVADVFRSCGRRPRCGKCLPDVAQMIEDARESRNPIRVAAE